MQRETAILPAARPRSDLRAALAWAAFAALVAAVKFHETPSAGNVFNIYRETGLRWLHGADLYPAELYFNYFPTAALLFVPWALLPFDIGGALWRVLNIAVFALGLWQLCAAMEAAVGRRRPSRLFAPASLIAIVLCWSAARHGQITLAMAGLMMAAAANVQRRAFWRAALYSTLAVALKPPAIVLLLVLCAVYPPVLWRSALLLPLLAGIPFLCQSPHYVLAQYTTLPDMFVHRATRIWAYPNAFGLLDSLGWVASAFERTALRAAAAAFVLLSCWAVERRGNRNEIGFYLYSSTSCFILLGGAGTEHNTYAMMGPIVGVIAAGTWRVGNTPVLAAMLALIAVTLASHGVMRAFPAYAPFAMLKPMVCSALFAYVAWRAWPRRRPEPAQPTTPSPAPRR